MIFINYDSQWNGAILKLLQFIDPFIYILYISKTVITMYLNGTEIGLAPFSFLYTEQRSPACDDGPGLAA